MKKLLILIFAIFLFPCMSWGATYYIDFASGNDANSGTDTDHPWKTIPGTRNIANGDWQSTSWGGGTINSSNRVPAETIFMLKSGSTHNTSNGGRVQIDSTYYLTSYTTSTRVVIRRDTTWGTGSVTFDGTGITAGDDSGHGIFYIRIGGIEFDGAAGVSNSYDGIIIQDSYYCGISNYGSGGSYAGQKMSYIKFSNNHTASAGYGSGDVGQVYFAEGTYTGNEISYCEFNGNSQNCNGLHFNTTVTATVDHCLSYNHIFNDGDDCGIGFKAQNSQVVYTNCEAYGNGKGTDNGQEGSPETVKLVYIFANCYFHDNDGTGASAGYGGGIIVNGPGPDASTGNQESRFIVVNCVVIDNYRYGIKSYGFAGKNIIIHNTVGSNNVNICVYPDGSDDTMTNAAYIYNNIGYKPVEFNLGVAITSSNSDLSIYSDYNSWIQKASETFAEWNFAWSDDYSFSYGSPSGPGRGTEATNNYWYTYYDNNGTQNQVGTGHYHCDPNSKGTGATDTTMPPFTDFDNGDYTLTAHYTGKTLSSEALWSDVSPYAATDKNGITRISWDIGAYEYENTAPTISNAIPSGTQVCTGPTQSVTLGVTTNEASTCIYSPVDDDFLDMSNYNSGVTFTTTGGTSHSGVTTLASNCSYIFYATCMDTSGVSNGASGTQIYFNINECTPEEEQGQVISPGVGTIKTVAPNTAGSGVFKIQ